MAKGRDHFMIRLKKREREKSNKENIKRHPFRGIKATGKKKKSIKK